MGAHLEILDIKCFVAVGYRFDALSGSASSSLSSHPHALVAVPATLIPISSLSSISPALSPQLFPLILVSTNALQLPGILRLYPWPLPAFAPLSRLLSSLRLRGGAVPSIPPPPFARPSSALAGTSFRRKCIQIIIFSLKFLWILLLDFGINTSLSAKFDSL